MSSSLISRNPGVISVGLAQFADSIVLAGGTALQLDWAPPALGNREAGMSPTDLVVSESRRDVCANPPRPNRQPEGSR